MRGHSHILLHFAIRYFYRITDAYDPDTLSPLVRAGLRWLSHA